MVEPVIWAAVLEAVPEVQEPEMQEPEQAALRGTMMEQGQQAHLERESLRDLMIS
jgi:hypothetical protein